MAYLFTLSLVGVFFITIIFTSTLDPDYSTIPDHDNVEALAFLLPLQMSLKKFTLKNLHFFYILLFLCFLGIGLIYLPNFFNIPKMIFIGIKIILFGFFVFFIVYSKLDLKKNLLSFVFFFFNYFIIFFMLFGTYIGVFYYKTPIKLMDITVISGLKYLLFIFATIIVLLFLLILKIKPILFIENMFIKIKNPYLQKEFSKIFEYYENSFWGDFFNYIIKKKAIHFVVFIIHFIFFFMVPCIQVIFFINFSFFKGSLNPIFYMLPFSLIAFLFKNLWFYFVNFFNVNATDLRKSLILVNQNEILLTYEKTIFDDIVIVDHSKVQLQLNREIFPEIQIQYFFLFLPFLFNFNFT